MNEQYYVHSFEFSKILRIAIIYEDQIFDVLKITIMNPKN
jgi:hypothetical protein